MQQLCISKDFNLYIYPRIMTKVNVSATVGMSTTVGEMSATVGKRPQQWGNLICSEKCKTRDCY